MKKFLLATGIALLASNALATFYETHSVVSVPCTWVVRVPVSDFQIYELSKLEEARETEPVCEIDARISAGIKGFTEHEDSREISCSVSVPCIWTVDVVTPVYHGIRNPEEAWTTEPTCEVDVDSFTRREIANMLADYERLQDRC